MNSSFEKGVQSISNKQYTTAIKHFTEALALSQSCSLSSYSILINRGFSYLNLHMDSSASQDFSSAICLEPYIPQSYFNKFIALYKQQKYKESLIELTICMSIKLILKGSQLKDQKLILEGISLVEDNPIGYFELGNLKKIKGDYEDAKKYYLKAIELDSENLKFKGRMLGLLKEFKKEEEFRVVEKQVEEILKNSDQKKYEFKIELKEQQEENIIHQQINKLLKQHHQLSSPSSPNLNLQLHSYHSQPSSNPSQLPSAIKQTQEPNYQSLSESLEPSNMLEQLQKQLNISNEMFSDSRAIDQEIEKVEKEIRAAKIELGDESEDQIKEGMQKILNFSSRERSRENIADQDLKETELQDTIKQQNSRQQQ